VHYFRVRVARANSNRKAESGLKVIVRGAGLPGHPHADGKKDFAENFELSQRAA
jgi:hypothetical protein